MKAGEDFSAPASEPQSPLPSATSYRISPACVSAQAPVDRRAELADKLSARASITVPRPEGSGLRVNYSRIYVVRWAEWDDTEPSAVRSKTWRQQPAARRHAANLRARGYRVTLVAGRVEGWVPVNGPRGGRK